MGGWPPQLPEAARTHQKRATWPWGSVERWVSAEGASALRVAAEGASALRVAPACAGAQLRAGRAEPARLPCGARLRGSAAACWAC